VVEGLLVHDVRVGLQYLVGDIKDVAYALDLAIDNLILLGERHYLKHQDAGAP